MVSMEYKGLQTSGTFPLDAKTTSAIAADPKAILGKTVTFTNTKSNGIPEVGYGTANAPLAGIVTVIEEDETAGAGWVVTVERSKVFEKVATASSATTAAPGAGVAVDGKGGVVTKPEVTNAICMALDAGKETCLVWVL